MEYVAIAKNIKISPRKVRLVVDGVKKQSVKNALSSLAVMNKRAARPIKKAIDSAMANAKNQGAAESDIAIKEILVSEGMALKRYHFAARGRVRPYKRRASQIRVILTDGKTVSKTPVVQEAPKEEKVESKSKTAEVKKTEGKERK
jgi:large subunit ribosomal protein L22